MKLSQSILPLILIITCITSCIQVNNPYTKLPPGQWRGILKITDPNAAPPTPGLSEADQKIIDYFELPFNLEVEYVDEAMNVYLVNGTEKIPVENIHFERDNTSAKDTLLLDFTAFDTRINAFYEENFIEGYWNVNYKEGYTIPVLIQYGQKHRFIDYDVADTYDFGGEWDVIFEFDDPENSYPAVGEFQQEGNKLSGTFLTETGDYRYLDGNAYGDKLRLSVFDGAHAFLFSGSVSQDTIYGEFRSGKHYKCNWIATKKSKDSSLQDPYNMTKAIGNRPVDFQYKNSEGQLVSINDPQYQGKNKLINIMGTWCPNCRDEANYLKKIKATYPEIEIFSLSFERYKDESKSIAAIKKYKNSMAIDWPILHAGYANKKENSEALSFLDTIYSYPTLIIVDKENQILDIHTGFNGPATSKFKSFDNSFRKKMDKLME